jgi:hypothetical protein
MQTLVSILHVVVYHLCSLGAEHKDRFVDLWGCWRTCRESEDGHFIALFRTNLEVEYALE